MVRSYNMECNEIPERRTGVWREPLMFTVYSKYVDLLARMPSLRSGMHRYKQYACHWRGNVIAPAGHRTQQRMLI